ncbi:unnamed protein product [Cuscuta campestris]|uniref:Uncharacterized protein n=1 Tax=Cuscuta campestris TaxID=132261 RepID=A0A484LPL3_9ASTE|nr:unnamed protein product [Cuscuta campestris]
MKVLISKLWEVGVTVVKTTEFVQGQTCRWGLAWSFVAPANKAIPHRIAEKTNDSFMLEGLQSGHSAFNLLQSVESFFCSNGASCKLNTAAFYIDITYPNEHSDVPKPIEMHNKDSANQINDVHFRVSVFQQIPGTLLVKGSLQKKDTSSNSGTGAFSLMFQRLEVFLRNAFCKEKSAR